MIPELKLMSLSCGKGACQITLSALTPDACKLQVHA